MHSCLQFVSSTETDENETPVVRNNFGLSTALNTKSKLLLAMSGHAMPKNIANHVNAWSLKDASCDKLFVQPTAFDTNFETNLKQIACDEEESGETRFVQKKPPPKFYVGGSVFALPCVSMCVCVCVCVYLYQSRRSWYRVKGMRRTRLLVQVRSKTDDMIGCGKSIGFANDAVSKLHDCV